MIKNTQSLPVTCADLPILTIEVMQNVFAHVIDVSVYTNNEINWIGCFVDSGCGGMLCTEDPINGRLTIATVNWESSANADVEMIVIPGPSGGPLGLDICVHVNLLNRGYAHFGGLGIGQIATKFCKQLGFDDFKFITPSPILPQNCRGLSINTAIVDWLTDPWLFDTVLIGIPGYAFRRIVCELFTVPTTTTTTIQPTTTQPTTIQPTTAQPTTTQPTTAQPSTAQPTTSEPTTSEPTTSLPCLETQILIDPNTLNLPKKCKEECDAFSVLAQNYKINSKQNKICIDYKIERLHDNKVCSPPIQQIVLGLCDNDMSLLSEDEIDDLILSLDIFEDKSNSQRLLAVSSESDSSEKLSKSEKRKIFGKGVKTNGLKGIKIEFDVDQETLDFRLCLDDVILVNGFHGFSNNARFITSQNRFNCKEEWIQGLPCITPQPSC